MRISNNISFQSKSKKIRKTDDFVRNINKTYCRISSSNILDSDYIDLFPNLKENLLLKTYAEMRFYRDNLYDMAESELDKIKAFIKPIKTYKIANCGESAHLAAVAAKANNIKNCHLAFVYNDSGKDLDHCVLFVNEKKPYIIDAWLGFADYIQNALLRYKGEFRNHFDLEENDSICLCTRIDDEYTDFFKADFSKSLRKKILKVFPEIKLPT